MSNTKLCLILAFRSDNNVWQTKNGCIHFLDGKHIKVEVNEHEIPSENPLVYYAMGGDWLRKQGHRVVGTIIKFIVIDGVLVKVEHYENQDIDLDGSIDCDGGCHEEELKKLLSYELKPTQGLR